MSKVITLLLAVLTFVALAKADFEDDCMDKHHITREELTKFSKGWTDVTVPVEKKFKCYTQCVLDELVDKDEHGKYIAKTYFDRDTSRNPSEEAIAKSKECNEKVEKVEDCEYAFNYMICVKTKN